MTKLKRRTGLHNPFKAAMAVDDVVMTSELYFNIFNYFKFTLQFKDLDGANLAAPLHFQYWLSETPGGAPTALTSVAVASTVGTFVNVGTDYRFGQGLTNGSGAFAGQIFVQAGYTYYLNIQLPSGKIVTSDAVVVPS